MSLRQRQPPQHIPRRSKLNGHVGGGRNARTIGTTEPGPVRGCRRKSDGDATPDEKNDRGQAQHVHARSIAFVSPGTAGGTNARRYCGRRNNPTYTALPRMCPFIAFQMLVRVSHASAPGCTSNFVSSAYTSNV